MLEVDRPRAIGQALEIFYREDFTLYKGALRAIQGNCIDESTTAGWQLACMVLDILAKDPKSDVVTVAFGKY